MITIIRDTGRSVRIRILPYLFPSPLYFFPEGSCRQETATKGEMKCHFINVTAFTKM